MKRHNLTKELVSRTNQMSFYKYLGMLPNPSKLFSFYGKNYQTYRNQKNDPHLWACIQSRKSGVLSKGFTLEQNGSSDETYNFIKKNLSNIDISSLTSQILEAVFMGFQVFEIVWQEEQFGDKMLYTLKKVEARPQEYFCFDTKGKLRLNIASGRYLSGYAKSKSSLPKYKTLLVQYEADYDNPYGQALLGKCYWPCTFKNTAMRFWVNYIEKYGLPTIIATSPDVVPADVSTEFLNNLLDMQETNAIFIGGNVDVKLHDNNKSGSVDLYRGMIEMCNAEISKVVLSGTLTTEIKVGSYAASQTHQEIRKEVIEGDIELVESSVNRLIRDICELNFGAVEQPLFKLAAE